MGKILWFLNILILIILTSAKPAERIIGGHKAEPGQFPYIVTVIYSDIPTYTICDGVIISEEWILTSGHCVYNHQDDFDDLSIGVGNVKLDETTSFYKFKDVIVHNDFDFDTSQNDIALIRLNTSLTFDENIKKIEIGAVEPNDSCIILGWGRTEFEGLPNELYYLETFALSMDECKEKLDPVLGNSDSHLSDSQICTFSKEGEGFCSGDGGGPVVSNGKLVGIMSYSVLTCGGGYPDVNTRTSAFADWIIQVTGSKI